MQREVQEWLENITLTLVTNDDGKGYAYFPSRTVFVVVNIADNTSDAVFVFPRQVSLRVIENPVLPEEHIAGLYQMNLSVDGRPVELRYTDSVSGISLYIDESFRVWAM